MNLVERAKNIIVTPKTEWEVIKNEQTTINEIFTKYVLILALIPAIAGFIGQSFIGISLGPFGNFKVPIGSGLLYLILFYILSVGSIYFIALIVDALAPSFGSQKNIIASLKVVAYSFTAAWIAGIFQLFPILGFIAFIGALYGLYLLYLGLQIVKETPQDKLIGYFVVVLIISIVAMAIIYWIVSLIALGGLMMQELNHSY